MFGSLKIGFFFQIICDVSPLTNSASSVTVFNWYSYLFKKLIIIVRTNRREIGGGVSWIFLGLVLLKIEKIINESDEEVIEIKFVKFWFLLKIILFFCLTFL